jgi:hypothetical protein
MNKAFSIVLVTKSKMQKNVEERMGNYWRKKKKRDEVGPFFLPDPALVRQLRGHPFMQTYDFLFSLVKSLVL